MRVGIKERWRYLDPPAHQARRGRHDGPPRPVLELGHPEMAPPGKVVQSSKGPPSMGLGRVGLTGPAEQRYWRLAAGPSLVWVTIRRARTAADSRLEPAEDLVETARSSAFDDRAESFPGLTATHRPNPCSSRAARTRAVGRGPSRHRARFGRLSNEERGIACQTEGPGPSNLSRTSFSASFGPTPRPMRSSATTRDKKVPGRDLASH